MVYKKINFIKLNIVCIFTKLNGYKEYIGPVAHLDRATVF